MIVQKRYIETFMASLAAAFLAVYLWDLYTRESILADVEAINKNSRVALMNWFRNEYAYEQAGIIRGNGQEISIPSSEENFE